MFDWSLPGLVVFIVAVVFGGYEIVERVWLRDVDMRLLHALHMARGIASTLLVAGAVVWRLSRREGAPPLGKIRTELGALGREEINLEVEWFIGLRWLAGVGAASAVFLSQHVLGLLPDEVTTPLWIGVAAIFIANLSFIRLKRGVESIRAFLLWQMAADLSILTYLLHFSGGIENPLFVVYVFHVILAGIFVSSQDAYLVTAGAGALFLFMTFGEYFHVLGHYTLILFPHGHAAGEAPSHAAHQFPFVIGISGTLLSVLAVTSYFTTAIMERLRESQRQLLRTERLSALGQLAAYIAHEVNNPIGIISARMKMARSGSEGFSKPEFLRETMEIVDRQADRVGRVVRSLLGFSKALPQPRSPVDINHAASEALVIAEGRISKTGIVLERHLDHGLPKVYARLNDLVHVFLNLINNAVDAMPRGGVLRVKTGLSNGSVEAMVQDTGEGISRENLEKIFEPFFTTKFREQGTGLGLSISLSLVKALGGEIKVESARGKGSLFTVRLPADNLEHPHE